MRCKDGIILGTEKIVLSKMMISGTDKRVYSITPQSGGVSLSSELIISKVVNGLTPDGRSLVQRAREESKQYEDTFGIKVPTSVLADRLAMKVQMQTVYQSMRPFGSSLILAAHDHIKGLGLYMIEPSGACFEYYGCASGRGKQLARNEIEKGNFREKTV